MNKQLKYLKLFEEVYLPNVPGYEGVNSSGLHNIRVTHRENLPEIYNKLTDEITGWIAIQFNQLTKLNGFYNLNHIDKYLWISSNDYMEEISGFNNLKTIRQGLHIQYNHNLKKITGFNSLTKIGGLEINNCKRLIIISIPGNLVRSVDYLDGYINYDNGLEFKSPPEFINSPVVINDLVEKFNPGEYDTQVINQIIENVNEWGTEETKQKVYSYLGQYLTPEQLTKLPDNIQHLYHPDYKNTSVRDVAKFNSGQIYGIF